MSSFRRAGGTGGAGGATAARARGVHVRHGTVRRGVSAKPGTRPWVSGQYVTSSGQEWLDRLVGSGLPTGTVTLVEEDEAGGHATTLASCFVAQGVLSDQHTVVVGEDGRTTVDAFVHGLPADRRQPKTTRGGDAGGNKASGKAGTQEDSGASGETGAKGSSGASGEAGTTGSNDSKMGDGNGGGDDGLRIAWQYRKYLSEDGNAPTLRAMPRPRSGRTSGAGSAQPPALPGGRSSRRKLGHTLDLSRRMAPDVLAANPVATHTVSSLLGDGPLWATLLATVEAHAAQAAQGRAVATGGRVHASRTTTPRVLRLCILGFMGPLWPSTSPLAAARFLLALRSVARRHRAVVLVTLPHARSGGAALRAHCRLLTDTVIQVSDFKDVPPESYDDDHAFREYTGMMVVHKLPSVNAMTAHTLDTPTFLFKRQHRKLLVEQLNLPPEESRSTSKPAPSGGGAALVPGLACATSLPGGDNSLEF